MPHDTCAVLYVVLRGKGIVQENSNVLGYSGSRHGHVTKLNAKHNNVVLTTSLRGEHINIASVLSAFSLSLFAIIQFCIATTHACRLIIAEFVSSF